MGTIVGNFLRKAKNVVVPLVSGAANVLIPGSGAVVGKVLGGAIDKREAQLAIEKSVAVPPATVVPLSNNLPPNLFEQTGLNIDSKSISARAAAAAPSAPLAQSAGGVDLKTLKGRRRGNNWLWAAGVVVVSLVLYLLKKK